MPRHHRRADESTLPRQSRWRGWIVTRRSAGPSAVRALSAGTLATIVGVLPLYLTGAMAVPLAEELRLSATGLGLAIGIFRLTGAATAIPMGRLVDRLGAIWSIRVAVIIAAVAGIGIATTASSWTGLVAWLMFASLANTLGQPAANRLVVNRISIARQGLAFGLKQSAPPVASMIAGLSVPVLAVTVGWRWSYGLIAIWAVLIIVIAGRRASPQPTARQECEAGALRIDGRTLAYLAVSFGVAAAASSVVPVFYVPAAVQGGMTYASAGLTLAAASAAAIIVRILGGAVADRIPHGHLRLCAKMLGLGSLGFVLLSFQVEWALVLGGIISLAGTWGFNGIFIYAVMRRNPTTPGSATGALLPGALIGAAVGPMLFGLAVDAYSYTIPWIVAAVTSVAASVMMWVSARHLDGPSARFH
jgi:MFS family permease